jgi:hypothetical protein
MTVRERDHEAISIGIAGQAICRVLEVLDRARAQRALVIGTDQEGPLQEAIEQVESRLIPVAAAFARSCALMSGKDLLPDPEDQGRIGYDLARLADLHDPRIHDEGAFRAAVQARLALEAKGRHRAV